MEETLFSIEYKNTTWYLDYNREDGTYSVFKDEKHRITRHSKGDCLEYIFDRLGSTRLVANIN